jgi:hypothetical protein
VVSEATPAGSWDDPHVINATATAVIDEPGNATAWPEPAILTGATRAEDPAARVITGHVIPANGGPVPGRTDHTAGERPLPEFLSAVLDAFDGDTRAHTVTLALALGISKQKLSELLRAIGVRPLPEAFSRGGTSLRGYERAHVEHAATRIRSGELPVPAEVAAWTAA